MEPSRPTGFALFEGLSDEQLSSCASRFQVVEILSDHNVAREGDDAYAFFLVLAGELDVHFDFDHIATLKPGDFFGEVGLELDTRRTAHVASRGRVQLAKMMVWDYKSMVEEVPVVHDRIAAVVAARTRQLPDEN